MLTSAVVFRKTIGAAALITLLALRIEPRLWRLPIADRSMLSNYFSAQADDQWWQYARFLDGVRAHTREGDKIVFIVPQMGWDSGYSYAYYRASYLLAGREVLPLVWRDDSPHLENLRAANYLGVWRARVPRINARLVWQGEGGVLLGR